ncbi:hypothetical protein AVEN_172359-2-1, partial [Araneus ventricosus]
FLTVNITLKRKSINEEETFSLKLATHHKAVLLHLDQQPVCFPPVQADPYRWAFTRAPKRTNGCFDLHLLH